MPIQDRTLLDSDRVRGHTDTVWADEPGVPKPIPPNDRPSLGPGANVGRYRVIARLGAGGMGVVYRAHDPQLDREIALKLLRSQNEQLAQRMLREARSVAKIRHQNVVTVYDAGEVDGQVFIAMELMSGTDLGNYFARQHSWQDVVRVMLQAAAGLRAAHDAGLVHRDFKPDNVRIEDDGSVKVLDFGLARPAYDTDTQTRMTEELAGVLGAEELAQFQTLTRTGHLVGTPAYMSPEQYLAEKLDARTDQFSFCVALYLGVYGHRPFAGRSPTQLLDNIVHGRIEQPGNPSIAPARLLAILRKGLARHPRDRYRSMDALIAELQALLDAAERPTRGSRWLLAALGLATLAVAVPVAINIQRQQHDGPSPDDGGTTDAIDVPPAFASTPDEPPLALELAVGKGRNLPSDGPQLWLSADAMRVVAKPGDAIQDIPFDAGDVAIVIEPLIAALAGARAETIAAEFDPLTLYVDKRTPFSTLVRVMYSAGRAGFSRFDFAVRTDAQVRVFEVEPPRFNHSDVELRRQVAFELELRPQQVEVGARLWAPNDPELATDPERWPLDPGAGSCVLDYAPAQLQVLARVAAELCALDGLSVPVIIGADETVTWQRLADVLSAALPSVECSRGIILEHALPAVSDCATPLSVAALAPKLLPAEPEPEFRRWCFINTSMRDKKECWPSQQRCVDEALHWVRNPKKACKGEP